MYSFDSVFLAVDKSHSFKTHVLQAGSAMPARCVVCYCLVPQWSTDKGEQRWTTLLNDSRGENGQITSPISGIFLYNIIKERSDNYLELPFGSISKCFCGYCWWHLAIDYSDNRMTHVMCSIMESKLVTCRPVVNILWWFNYVSVDRRFFALSMIVIDLVLICAASVCNVTATLLNYTSKKEVRASQNVAIDLN